MDRHDFYYPASSTKGVSALNRFHNLPDNDTNTSVYIAKAEKQIVMVIPCILIFSLKILVTLHDLRNQ